MPRSVAVEVFMLLAFCVVATGAVATEETEVLKFKIVPFTTPNLFWESRRK